MSKKNAIVVIAIGKSKKWDICKKTVNNYCKKHNLLLEVITKKKYNIKKFESINNFNIFEKNQVYELFDKYDRILRLDWDLIITPDCPNLFEIVPKDEIGVLLEDVGTRKMDRRKRILRIQQSLGDIGWKEGYINTGVVLASKMHREIFLTTIDDMETMEKVNLKLSKEQNFFNFSVRKAGFKIFPLDFKFNHTSVYSEPWNGCYSKFKSFIIHYAGKINALELMVIDYNYIFFNRKRVCDFKIISSLLKIKNTIKEFVRYSRNLLKNRKSSYYQNLRRLMEFFKRYLDFLKYW